MLTDEQWEAKHAGHIARLCRLMLRNAEHGKVDPVTAKSILNRAWAPKPTVFSTTMCILDRLGIVRYSRCGPHCYSVELTQRTYALAEDP